MKRLFNFMPAVLLIAALAACGKQAGAESTADKAAEQYGQTGDSETTGWAEQE